MTAMMGERRVNQDALFYSFSLERHVPVGHMVRAIDGFVDLSDLRSRLAPFYSPTGSALDRSRTSDPDAADRLLLWYSVRAAALRGSSPQSRLSLVLPAGPRR